MRREGGGDDGAEQHRQNTERYPCQHTSQRVTLSSVSSVSRWVAYIYIYIYIHTYIYILNFVHFYSEKYIHVHTYMLFFICDGTNPQKYLI